ncbi:hypothetical protein Tco_1142242 [Tanacetum coccineum]
MAQQPQQQNIPCSEECKIVGILLVDHALSHALTTTTDVPFDTLKLLVETSENPFIVPADLKYIPRFLRIVSYEGIVDKKKDSIQYPLFTKLIITDLMKKFPSIALRLEEDYHSIKDDVPLGVMDPNSSLGKICLGEDVVVISSDKVEGSGDWNSSEFQDTSNSGQKKAMVFYQMDTEEVSDRFVAPCFVNGLEAYDGEINLGVEENMISNEYAVKLCLEHEVKRGNKVVKKELIVALRGEIYFVKFIINPEEDDVEPGVIFGRSFLRMTKAITNFGVGTVTIYPDIDPFLEETEEEENSNDDWDHLLDFNIDDVPVLGEEGLPPFVCKMRKSSRNKKRAMENLNFFYQDIGTSSSAGGHLT